MKVNLPSEDNRKGRKFGINSATLNTITYKKNDKDNFVLTVDVTIDGTDKSMWTVRFPIRKVFIKGVTVIDLDNGIGSIKSPEYIAELESLTNEMVHILMSFMTFEEIEAAFDKVKDFTNSEDLLYFTAKLAEGKCEGKRVNVFLTYPWNVGSDGKKYLNLPKTAKHGFWIAPHISGLKPKINEEGNTHYVNSDGEESPIKRTKWFMESAFAKKEEVNLTEPVESNVEPW